jgi:hypothetical protein
MRVSGGIARRKAMVRICILTAASTLGSSKMGYPKVMVTSIGKMEATIRGSL